MATFSVWILGESNVSISGGKSLDGITQGDGSHLVGETVTLTSSDWVETFLRDNDTDFDDNDGNQRLDGDQTINGTSYTDGTRVEAEYRIVLDDGNGNSYEAIAYNIVNSSPAYGTVEALSFVGPPQGWPPVGVPLTVTTATEGPGSSGQPDLPADDLVVPCFTPGTRIRVPGGTVPVETLVAGDVVTTRDHGPRRLRWVGRVRMGRAELAREPALCPIRVRAGALGPRRPVRDTLMSPQHRVLVSGWRPALLFGADEVLAAVSHLVNGHSIDWAGDVAGVTYIHIMFDRHEIVFANGIATESFRPGPQTLPALPARARDEVLRLFPELVDTPDPAIAPARPMLKGWEASVLV